MRRNWRVLLIWAITSTFIATPVLTGLAMIWMFSAPAWTQGNLSVLAINILGSLVLFGGLTFVAYMVREITRPAT